MLQTLCKTYVAATLQDSCALVRFSVKEFRFQEIAIPLHATGGEDRPPPRTHIFLSCVCVSHLIAFFTRTCVRVAQDHDSDMIGCCCTTARLLKSHPILTSCFTDRSSTCLTHFHHVVPRHRRRHLTHCC